MKAPMWWVFSATDSWTLLIDTAKNTEEKEYLSGQEHWCGISRRTSSVRISILVLRKKRRILVNNVFWYSSKANPFPVGEETI